MPGGNLIGIRTASIVTAAQAVTSSTVLVNATQLIFTAAAATRWLLRFNIPFSTGAAGGAKFQIIAPTVTQFQASWQLYLNGSPGTLADAAVQTTSAAFANALASAGNSLMTATAWIVTSAAGTIGLQFAQNGSNATPITLLVGGSMEVTQF